jgi:hypothetical protein
LIPLPSDVPLKETIPTLVGARTPAENCKRIRALGFSTSRHITMYGERLEIVSDPFDEGGCTAIRVLSGNDPTVRTVRLPVAILIGLSDRFRKK